MSGIYYKNSENRIPWQILKANKITTTKTQYHIDFNHLIKMKYSEINPSILTYDKDSDLNLKKKMFSNKLCDSPKAIMMIPTPHQDKYQKV